MRISDWSSDVCSSDLLPQGWRGRESPGRHLPPCPASAGRYWLPADHGAFCRNSRLPSSAYRWAPGRRCCTGCSPAPIRRTSAVPSSTMPPCLQEERKSIVEGKGVTVREDAGGGRYIKK